LNSRARWTSMKSTFYTVIVTRFKLHIPIILSPRSQDFFNPHSLYCHCH
jgi:hypothetical protein